MPDLGIHLTLLIGPTVPIPAAPSLVEALRDVEVTHRDDGPSGFQINFEVGRGGLSALIDYELLSSPQLRPMNRVILVVTLGVIPTVLIDGIITHQQLKAASEPGASLLTITGEDVSVMMDLEEKSVEHPAQDETLIALKLIASYAQYGLIPTVIPPLTLDPPIPIDRIPVQQGTDRDYLLRMARRHGYVFYVKPGPAPGTNIAYWGPPNRLDIPAKALSVNFGHLSNVETLDFSYDALAPTTVRGQIQDRLTQQTMPVQTFASLRLPPLASQPAILVQQPNVRSTQLRASGLNIIQAFGRAQGMTDASTDAVLTASGEVDTARYGAVLHARGLVGVRGAGYQHDGLYYVQRVTHQLREGEYRQSFALSREGMGALTPVVPP